MAQQRVVVIGAGPGGYPAAFLAADLGMEVTVVDLQADLGGVCLHRGCIPSKALLHVAKLVHEFEHAAMTGLSFGPPEFDLNKLQAWRDQVIARMEGGLKSLVRSRKVKLIEGRARFDGAETIMVDKSDGTTERLSFDQAVIATGSVPIHLDRLFPTCERVMDSTDALQIKRIPENLLVVGGGYIGLELGSVYAALGAQVSVVEAQTGILPGVDRDMVDILEGVLRGQLHEILLNTKVTEARETADGIEVKLVGLDLDEPVRTFDQVLVAVGRRPNSQDLGLAEAGLAVNEQGFITTDLQCRTSVPNIFAVGDVAGQPMLAHKATYEAKVAVEAMRGEASARDAVAIPAVVFTDPELAWAGLTETEALQRDIPVVVTRFPWGASGRATTIGRNEGLTKLICETGTDRVLGMGIVGYGAGEMIAEGVLAVEMGATATDLKMTIHAHPTLSETVMEAAELPHGPSTHVLTKSKPRTDH